MAAVVSGLGLGLFNTSLNQFNGYGVTGNAGMGGSGGDRIYVNVGTGNLVVQSQDEYLASQGLDAVAIRTYNSKGLMDDDNTDNWRFSLSRALLNLPAAGATTAITRLNGDSNQASFTYSNGIWISHDGAGAHDTLRLVGNEWHFEEGSTGAREIYDVAGRLLLEIDRDLNGITYAYTDMGDVASITNASGERVEFGYIALTHKVNAIRLVKGGVTTSRVSYTYDLANRLRTVKVDLTPEDGSITDGNVFETTYSYGLGGRLSRIDQSDGASLKITYAAMGLLSTDYRVSTLTTVVDDDVVRELNFDYDIATIRTDVTNEMGAVTSYYHDSAQRLIKVEAPSVSGVRATVSYGYDGAGNVVSVTTTVASGVTRNVTYEYDGNGNVTLSRDSLGYVKQWVYGTANQLLSEALYIGADPDGSGPVSPSDPKITRYVYDSEYHLRFVIDADRRVTQNIYNSVGQLTSTIRYAANTYTSSTYTEAAVENAINTFKKDQAELTELQYDFRGQLHSRKRYSALTTAGAGTGAVTATYYVYSPSGQLLQTVDARHASGASASPGQAYVTSYVYDGMGRIVATTDASGRTSTTSYASADAIVVTLTTPHGLVTESSYNFSGDAVRTSVRSSQGNHGVTEYFYDPVGRLRMIKAADGTYEHHLYDERGWKVAVIDAGNGLTEYVYDLAGQITQTIRYAAKVTATLRSGDVPANVTLADIRPTSTPNGDRKEYNLYDAAGRLVFAIVDDTVGLDAAVSIGRNVIGYEYDAAGRLLKTIAYQQRLSTSVALTEAAVRSSVSSANATWTRNFYSDAGQLLGTLDAKGYLTTYGYDSIGRQKITHRWANQSESEFWESGTLTQVIPIYGSEDDQRPYSFYDAQGRVAGTLDAMGYVTAFEYDVAGNKKLERRYSGQVLYSTNNTLADLIIKAEQATPYNQPMSRSRSWVYDALDRVVSETDFQGIVTQYNYNSVTGFLTSVVAGVGLTEARAISYQYDLAGRLLRSMNGEGSAALAAAGSDTTAQNTVWNSYGTAYRLDAAGRVLQETDPTGNFKVYYYNLEGKVRYIVSTGDKVGSTFNGEVTEYFYNVFGEVSQTTRYYNRVPVVSGEGGVLSGSLPGLVADNARDRKTVTNYTLRGLKAQAVDPLGTTTWSQYTALGSVAQTKTQRRLTSAGDVVTRIDNWSYDERGLLKTHIEGSRTEEFSYDAFGRRTAHKDFNAATWETAYDKVGQIVRETDPLGHYSQTAFDAFSRRISSYDKSGSYTSYEYDDATKTMTVYAPSGVVTRHVSNAHGEEISVTLNNMGRTETTTYEYDKDGRVKRTIVDPVAEKITSENEYDKAGLLKVSTDANGVRTTYTYDPANRLLTHVLDEGTGTNPSTGQAFLNAKTTYKYNAFGEGVTVTNPANVVSETLYDLGGRRAAVIADTGGLKFATVYTYDTDGNYLEVREGIQASGSTGSWNLSGAARKTTRYEYDSLGRRIKEIVDPASGGLNLTTVYDYDNEDHVVRKRDASGNYWRYTYDAAGQLVHNVDPLGYVTENRYDKAGRLTQTVERTQSMASQLATNSSGFGSSTMDWNGNMSVVTAQQAGFESGSYALVSHDRDATNNVFPIAPGETLNVSLEVRRGSPASGGQFYPARIGVMFIRRNSDGSTYPDWIAGSSADPNVTTTQKLSGTVVVPSNAISASVWVQIDGPHGNSGSWFFKNAYVGRPQGVSLDWLDAGGDQRATTLDRRIVDEGVTDRVTRYEYDGNGRLVKLIDAEGKVETYGYDHAGNRIWMLNKIGNQLSPSDTVGREKYTWRYQYDAAGRLTKETKPAVQSVVPGPSENFTVPDASLSGAVLWGQDFDEGLTGLTAVSAATSATQPSAYFTTSGTTYGSLSGVRTYATSALTGSSAVVFRSEIDVPASGEHPLWIGAQGNDGDYLQAYFVGRKLYAYRPSGTIYLGEVDPSLSYVVEVITGRVDSHLYVYKKGGRREDGFVFHHASRIDAAGFIAKGSGGVDAYRIANVCEYKANVTTSGDSLTSGVVGRYYDNSDWTGTLVTRTDAVIDFDWGGGAPVSGIGADTFSVIWNGAIEVEKSGFYSFHVGGDDGYFLRIDGNVVLTRLRDQEYTETSGGMELEAGRRYAIELKYYENNGQAALKLMWTPPDGTKQVVPASALYQSSARTVAVTPQFISAAPALASIAVETVIEYDDVGNVKRRREAANTAQERVTEFKYDAADRQVETLRLGVTSYVATQDPAGIARARTETTVTVSSRVTYDLMGNAAASVDGAGVKSYKVYDAANRLRYEIDGKNFVTAYDYDASGNQTKITRFSNTVTLPAGKAYYTMSDITPTASATDRTITKEYDKSGRIKKISQPEVYAYEKVLSGSIASGVKTPSITYEYDKAGRPIKESIARADGSFASTYSYYDVAGNLTAQIDPSGYLTEWIYEKYGTVVRKIEYASAATSWSTSGYTRANYVTPATTGSAWTSPTTPDMHRAHDGTVLTQQHSGADRISEIAVDRMGRMVRQSQLGIETVSFVEGANGYIDFTITTSDLHSRMIYDAVGNVVVALDPQDAATTTYYDATGRITAIVKPRQLTGIEGTTYVLPLTAYIRDLHGNVIHETRYANGATQALVGVYTKTDNPASDEYISRLYDKWGNLQQETDPRGQVTSYSYDIYGNVRKTWAAYTDAVGIERQFSTILTYDELGRAKNEYEVDYDGAQQSAVQRQLAYNAFGEITAKGVVSVGDGWQEEYQYDNAGRVLKGRGADGVAYVYAYDLQGRLTAKYQSATYDVMGASYTQQQVETASTDPASKIVATRNIYDALGRLVRQELPSFYVGRGSDDQVTWSTPKLEQQYDRWNNVRVATDARGYSRYYAYDSRNLLLQRQDGLATIYNEEGVSFPAVAVALYGYDKAGNRIAELDSRGHVNAAAYNAGGKVLAEYHADRGRTRHYYNALERETSRVNALNFATSYSYDKAGYLLRQSDADGRLTEYDYDALGNRTTQRVLTSPTTVMAVSRQIIDGFGRVRKDINASGIAISYGYDALGNKIQESYADGKSKSWVYNEYGLLDSHTDMGANQFDYTYNKLSLLTSQFATSGTALQSLAYSYDDAGHLLQMTDSQSSTRVLKTKYDIGGLAVREVETVSGGTVRETRIGYNEVGYLNAVVDYRSGVQRFAVVYGYDLIGNRKFVQSSRFDFTNTTKVLEYYYRYDAMNRLAVSQGVRANGAITHGTSQGSTLKYDFVGNRVSEVKVEGGQTVTRTYEYDYDNRLRKIYRNGMTELFRIYDYAGRTIAEYLYEDDGTLDRRHDTLYYEDGRMRRRYTGDGSVSLQLASFDLVDSYDAAGNLKKYTLQNWEGSNYTNTYTYSYLYRESALEEYAYVNNSGGTSNTRQYYDANGNVIRVDDTKNNSLDRTLTLDVRGQIQYKDQGNSSAYYFYAAGQQIGWFDKSGKYDVDFNYEPISETYPALAPSSYVSLDGDTVSRIARTVYGDASLWYLIADANGLSGDELLAAGTRLTIPNLQTNIRNAADTIKPYNAAEIIGDTTPTMPVPPSAKKCGGLLQVIVIIVAVVVTIYTAGAASAAIGAAFGATAAGTTAAAVAVGAAAAAAGSVVSQLTANALGLQSGFSWSAVGQAALAGGLTAGLVNVSGIGQGVHAAVGSGNYAQAAAYSLAQNAVGQGVGLTLGQQDKFSWSALAASAVGGVIDTKLGSTASVNEAGKIGQVGGSASPFAISRVLVDSGKQFVRGVMTRATQIAIDGAGKFEFAAIAADAFGNALGNSIVGAMQQREIDELADNPQALGKVAGLSENEQKQYANAYARVNGQPEPYPDVAPTNEYVGGEGGSTRYAINWGAIDNKLDFDVVRQGLTELAQAGTTRAYSDLARLNQMQLATHQTYDSIDEIPAFQAGMQRGIKSVAFSQDSTLSRLRGQDFANPANWGARDRSQIAASLDPLIKLAEGLAIGGTLIGMGGLGLLTRAGQMAFAAADAGFTISSLANGDPWGAVGLPALGRNVGTAIGLGTDMPGLAAVVARSEGAALGGKLYSDIKATQLVKYLEKRGVSVVETQGNARFIARADGTGQMQLPANATELQVKHELSHYLDFKQMGFEAYRDVGRLGREEMVLNRLQANRLWSQLNEAEVNFSVNYVERLRMEALNGTQ